MKKMSMEEIREIKSLISRIKHTAERVGLEVSRLFRLLGELNDSFISFPLLEDALEDDLDFVERSQRYFKDYPLVQALLDVVKEYERIHHEQELTKEAEARYERHVQDQISRSLEQPLKDSRGTTQSLQKFLGKIS